MQWAGRRMGTRLVSAASMAALCQALYSHEIGGLFGPWGICSPFRHVWLSQL